MKPSLSFDEFKTQATRHNVIPLFVELPADLDTPVTAFLKIKSDRYDFLLESVVGGEKWARYSFLGTNPSQVYTVKEQNVHVACFGKPDQIRPYQTNPLDVLREDFKKLIPFEDPRLPRFFGGVVGSFAYDLVYNLEHIPPAPKTESDVSCFTLLRTKQMLIFDNLYQVVKITVVVELSESDQASDAILKTLYTQALIDLSKLKEKLKRPTPALYDVPAGRLVKESQGLQQKEFEALVEKARDYIAAGDIFQVVLSLPFYYQTENLNPFEVYRAIRRINPSPYMFYFNFGSQVVVGASPEVLVRLEDHVVEVRPIAGTRKRGLDEAHDLQLEKELRSDPKEQAEHIMLVDLGRHDVGRVAKTGTVKVDEQAVVERYSHVMHLVSHVSGEKRDDVDAFDVIVSTFPAGTLSGAPKIRAMQIISELEPTRRGLYGGAVGYVGFNQNLDLAITIRTALIKEGVVRIQAGAGVVYNSDPALEYKECENKAKGMKQALLEALGVS